MIQEFADILFYKLKFYISLIRVKKGDLPMINNNLLPRSKALGKRLLVAVSAHWVNSSTYIDTELLVWVDPLLAWVS